MAHFSRDFDYDWGFCDQDELEAELRNIVKHGKKMDDQKEEDESLMMNGGEPSFEAGTPILEIQGHKRTRNDPGR